MMLDLIRAQIRLEFMLCWRKPSLVLNPLLFFILVRYSNLKTRLIVCVYVAFSFNHAMYHDWLYVCQSPFIKASVNFVNIVLSRHVLWVQQAAYFLDF